MICCSYYIRDLIFQIIDKKILMNIQLATIKLEIVVKSEITEKNVKEDFLVLTALSIQWFKFGSPCGG